MNADEIQAFRRVIVIVSFLIGFLVGAAIVAGSIPASVMFAAALLWCAWLFDYVGRQAS